MDAEKITAYCVGLAGVISAVASYFLNRQKSTAADERADRKLVAGQSEFLFSRLLKRIESLEDQMHAHIADRVKCEEHNEQLQAEIDQLKAQNVAQQLRIAELEKAVGKISREVR